MNKNTFAVTGMHCASCATIISKALKKVAGVKEAEVNYATEMATIMFDAEPASLDEMNTAVTKYGYRLVTTGTEKHPEEAHRGGEEHEREMDSQRAKTEFVCFLRMLLCTSRNETVSIFGDSCIHLIQRGGLRIKHDGSHFSRIVDFGFFHSRYFFECFRYNRRTTRAVHAGDGKGIFIHKSEYAISPPKNKLNLVPDPQIKFW
jgi:cation transport ATPase